MREKFIRFMQGRYGNDQFNRMLSILAIIFLLLSMFIRINILYYIGFAIMIYTVFRSFSRNIYKRSAENTKYLSIKASVKDFFKRTFPGKDKNVYNSKCNSYRPGENYNQAAYKIFSCPSCKQKLRVPKGKGKIEISCRRCGTHFVKRT